MDLKRAERPIARQERERWCYQAERINRRYLEKESKEQGKEERKTPGASHPVSHGVRRKERHIE